MVLILHQSGASHGHSHGFPSGRLQGDEQRPGHGHHHGNASVRAAFIHVVGDLVQSVGVLLAATIIHFCVSDSQNTRASNPLSPTLVSIICNNSVSVFLTAGI